MSTGQAHRLVTADEGALDSDWSALCERTGASAFYDPGFVRLWASAFAPAQLRVLTAYRGADLVGVLPLVQHGRRWSAAANVHSPAAGPVSLDDAATGVLAAALLDHCPSALWLPGLDADDPAIEASASS